MKAVAGLSNCKGVAFSHRADDADDDAVATSQVLYPGQQANRRYR